MNIVLLPGLDGTGKLFEAFISYLPSELSSVVCTYPDDASLGYKELTEFAYHHCPENEPFLLLGESFSGPIAIEIAARNPPKLKGLVLVNTFAACPRLKLCKLARSLPSWLLSRPPKPLLNILLQEKEIGVEPLEALHSVLSTLPITLIRSRLASVEKIEVQHIARDIKVPVCIVQSEDDMALPHRARKQLQNALSMSQTHKLKGNHFALQTHPNEVSNIVTEFHRKLAL